MFRRFFYISLVLGLVSQEVLAQLDPAKALSTMKVGEGLQVELFAAEPLLINPTAIDVDHRGRVGGSAASPGNADGFRGLERRWRGRVDCGSHRGPGVRG